MSKEVLIKKCLKCGATVRVLEDCKCGSDCGIKCCGEKMHEVVPNSVDASAEKHVPTYEIKDGKIFLKVNHVMEDEHYIEWISVIFGDSEKTTYFKPGEEPTMHCKYIPGFKIYAYCNKHGLWKVEE